MKITPALTVDEIESSLPFWIDRMGFQKIVGVPETGKLAFVILAHNGAELMMQTTSSVEEDTPQFVAKTLGSSAFLYIEVDDFSETAKRLSEYPIAMPERVTFYGMREVGVFDPGGHVVVFAARVAT